MHDDDLVLTSSRATARVELLAGRLASLVVDDMEVLVTEGAKASRFGSFPMVPWCGRLNSGMLNFNGTEHEFPLTSPPHANHGTAMFQTWDQVGPTEIAVDMSERWPFGGLLAQRFELTDTSFTVHMELTAADQAMPAQMGWHPWYRRDLGRGAALELEFAADSIYETDDEQLPTGNIVPAPPGPWDETFIGVTQTPILRWGDALTIALSSNFDHWVVFTKPDHAVAIEPQSGAPNDLNRAPHVLEPGQPLAGWMTLDWSSD